MAKYKNIKKPVSPDHQQQSSVQDKVSEQHTSMIKLQTKSQVYSNLVFNKVNELVNSNEGAEKIKRYRSLCKRSGGLLRTVGLIQFLTFLAAKATKESEVHHQYLLDHLVAELKIINVLKANNSDNLLEQVRQQNLPQYMHTTTQILKLLQWHKRIADILIAGEE